MSYILDALKKSQAESNDQGISLNPQSRTRKRKWIPLLVGVVVVLILANAATVIYILQPDRPDQTQATTNPPTPSNGEALAPVTSASGASSEVSLAVETVDSEITIPPSTLSNSIKTTNAEATMRSPINPGTSIIERFNLSQLTDTEQLIYNGFNYSTHIYTEDPSLCAVVVDGTRLKAGDAFKGLKVVQITETGVIFEENRRGKVREIEVSVLEQWD